MSLVKISEKKRWTTASRLDRAAECLASTVLPEDRDDTETAAQVWGQAWHQVVELRGRLGRSSAFRNGQKVECDWPDWVVRGVGKKLDQVRGSLETSFEEFWDHWYPLGAAETSIVIDGPALENVSLVFGDFEDSATSIRIKADYIGTKLGDPWVDDLKTGRRPSDPGDLQVATAAYALSRMTGSEAVWGSITHWPRYPLANGPTRAWHYYDAEELDIVRNKLLTMRTRAYSEPVILLVNPAKDEWGEPIEQCKYCKSIKYCPAWQTNRSE